MSELHTPTVDLAVPALSHSGLHIPAQLIQSSGLRIGHVGLQSWLPCVAASVLLAMLILGAAILTRRLLAGRGCRPRGWRRPSSPGSAILARARL